MRVLQPLRQLESVSDKSVQVAASKAAHEGLHPAYQTVGMGVVQDSRLTFDSQSEFKKHRPQLPSRQSDTDVVGGEPKAHPESYEPFWWVCNLPRVVECQYETPSWCEDADKLFRRPEDIATRREVIERRVGQDKVTATVPEGQSADVARYVALQIDHTRTAGFSCGGGNRVRDIDTNDVAGPREGRKELLFTERLSEQVGFQRQSGCCRSAAFEHELSVDTPLVSCQYGIAVAGGLPVGGDLVPMAGKLFVG